MIRFMRCAAVGTSVHAQKKLLQTFAAKFPGVSFEISVIDRDGIVQAVVQEHTEIGLVSRGWQTPARGLASVDSA
jgi:hypothetical protein